MIADYGFPGRPFGQGSSALSLPRANIVLVLAFGGLLHYFIAP